MLVPSEIALLYHTEIGLWGLRSIANFSYPLSVISYQLVIRYRLLVIRGGRGSLVHIFGVHFCVAKHMYK